MTCTDFHEQVALLALGALTPEEANAVSAHLREGGPHEGCAQALAEARGTVAALDAALPAVAPRVWARIEAQLDAPPVPATSRHPAASRPPSPAAERGGGATVLQLTRARRRERVAWVSAAAAAAVAVWGWGQAGALREERDGVQAAAAQRATELATVQTSLASVRTERAECQRLLEDAGKVSARAREAVAMLERPTSRLVALGPAAPGGQQRAFAVYDPAEGRAMVMARDMVPEAGKVLQLWVIRGNGAPVPAGFMEPGQGMSAGEVRQEVLGPGAPDAFAVSLEPAGGSASPTQVLMVGKLAS
jgi:anti-sigma-K factor RskA